MLRRFAGGYTSDFSYPPPEYGRGASVVPCPAKRPSANGFQPTRSCALRSGDFLRLPSSASSALFPSE